MLPDLVMAMSRPKLKVSSPKSEHDGQRIFLGDCEARYDVWRYERHSWPGELVGKLCQDLCVPLFVRDEGADDCAAGMLEDCSTVLHAVHANVVSRRQDEPPERLVSLRRSDRRNLP